MRHRRGYRGLPGLRMVAHRRRAHASVTSADRTPASCSPAWLTTPVAGARALSDHRHTRPPQVREPAAHRLFWSGGAYTWIVRLTAAERRPVAASAGNHAQGVALAARLLGVATVFMPERATLPKVDATAAMPRRRPHRPQRVDDGAGHAAAAQESGPGSCTVRPSGHRRPGHGRLRDREQVPDATVLVPAGGGAAHTAAVLRRGGPR
ncbi:pyridoxal-phosphate dependent enzyme [Pseudonocardia sp. MCCB 268]|nr:pyridoxal-phosphate dependent enzyme [Pseudonocardia cytotoxica]